MEPADPTVEGPARVTQLLMRSRSIRGARPCGGAWRSWAPAGGRSGLKAGYFDNADLTTQRGTCVDPQGDSAWGLGVPYPSLDPDYFSVRWTGFVEPAASGPHTSMSSPTTAPACG